MSMVSSAFTCNFESKKKTLKKYTKLLKLCQKHVQSECWLKTHRIQILDADFNNNIPRNIIKKYILSEYRIHPK